MGTAVRPYDQTAYEYGRTVSVLEMLFKFSTAVYGENWPPRTGGPFATLDVLSKLVVLVVVHVGLRHVLVHQQKPYKRRASAKPVQKE
eukprot:SAG31_NODE_11789_length_998_cov_1.341491_1_plen_88_part_00